MRSLLTFLPLALEGEWGDWRAIVVVVIAFVMLVGSIYMLLASNYGAYVGWLVLNVGFWGWMVMLSLIWLVGVPGTLPGTGPRTQEPHWVPFLAESEQGQEFTREIDAFPQRWDEPGKIYEGNIDSRGELETLKHEVRDALARLAASQDLAADEAKDWDYRLPTDPVATEDQRALPVAQVRYHEGDTPLLARVEIPATRKHTAMTVYALRDKGRTYLNSLYFLVASILGLVVSTMLLARHETRQKAREALQT